MKDPMNLVTRPTAELQGRALDWAVAQVEGIATRLLRNDDGTLFTNPVWADGFGCYAPSINWSRCGPLIVKYKVSLLTPTGAGDWWVSAIWIPDTARTSCYGPTPLIAACRAIVAAQLGDTVQVPEELLV